MSAGRVGTILHRHLRIDAGLAALDRRMEAASQRSLQSLFTRAKD